MKENVCIYMRFNKQYCSFTHGGGESRTFRPGGLCQLLTETKTSRSKCPALTSPVCKAAVLLVKSHVNSRNAAMSLYQIRVYVAVSLPAVIPVGTDCGLG